MIGRHVSGAVLAGGMNTRFGGQAKGLLELGGRRLIDRVLDALRLVADESFVIANDANVRRMLGDVRVYADVRPERASLVGLHTALTNCRDGVLAVAWDMPFIEAALLAELRNLGEAAGTAAIPVGPRGPEPCCAYYPRASLSTVERQLDRGELRLSAFVAALPCPALLSAPAVSRFGDPVTMFANINTPADLTVASHLEHR
jgi:molybdopterin-guanine dinucleotide biosynthesis protein A